MKNDNDKNILENPKIVFIDTSAIDPMFNHFGKMKEEFEFLKKWVDEERVVLFTNEIVLREVKSHIQDLIPKQIESIKKSMTSREFSIINMKEKYKQIMPLFDEQKIIEETYNGFYNLLITLNVSILNNDEVFINSILDDYFNNLPPFGVKDKKHEFPDAIMLKTFLNKIEQDDIVHIIANDGDWKNVCKKYNFYQYNCIKDFLDYLNKNNAIRPDIINYIQDSKTQNEIIDRLLIIFESLNYTVNGLDYDRKGIVSGYEYDEIELVNISNLYFKVDTIENIDYEINEDKKITFKITLSLISSCDVAVECNYFDEEKSIWDSEDKRYIYERYGTIIENHEVIMPIRIKLIATSENANATSKLSFTIKDFERIDTDHDISELDNRTLISREFVQDDADYEWLNGNKFSVERIYKCPHCNEDIKVDLISNETECICSNEREMGIENEYQIDVRGNCPHCDKGYLITGFLWEYPVLTFNYEQDIKIMKDK